MGFLCTRSPGSLSISPLPSYVDLPRFVILGMSSSSLIATLISHLVSLLSYTSLIIFFYPHRSLSCFMNDVSFGVHPLLLGIVHLCLLIRVLWHCAKIRSLHFVSGSLAFLPDSIPFFYFGFSSIVPRFDPFVLIRVLWH